MSKIIDVLSRRLKKSSYITDPIQEELANTFFPSSIKKYKSQNKVSKTPWVIAGLVLFVAIFFMITGKNVNINVKIVKQEKTPISEDRVAIIEKGKFNTKVIKSMYFDGDAKNLSQELPDSLLLVNSGKSGWANFTLEFAKPVSLKEFDITYNAKGDSGGEHLALVFVDSKNSSYRMESSPEMKLTDKWKDYEASLKSASGIDFENISKVKFEFGGLTVGNSKSTKIFLKDIFMTKARGVKWL
ncbi:MAG: hypothetical protein ABIH57_02985 [Candidatus Omnitrophota bacterium]